MSDYDKVIYVIKKIFKYLDNVDCEVVQFSVKRAITVNPEIIRNDSYIIISSSEYAPRTVEYLYLLHISNNLYTCKGRDIHIESPTSRNMVKISSVAINPYQVDTVKKYSELYNQFINTPEEEMMLYLKMGGEI